MFSFSTVSLRRAVACTAIFVLALLVRPLSAGLDEFYYTNDEIKSELDSLQALYPDWIRVDSIGYAYETGAPIWSAKVSDFVNIEEDEPALWVNGSCHAEEILGINVTMGFVRELVALGSIGHPQWAPIIQNMEIHAVASNNPDGMEIVMDESDVTYRKNLHSLMDDGDCQITPGIGNDSCGVDLNRNYPAWWNHGDTLWIQNDDLEQYDYFRGEYPLSEPECRCIADQTERERFVAAVAYHSARTSTNHEIIIHPWEWVDGRTCPAPDHEMMQDLTRNMGDQIRGQHYEYYRNLAGLGRKGNHHNWIYSHYGSIGLLIEVGLQGGPGMQPEDQETIDFIVDENVNGLNWLCRRIIGYEVAAPGMVLHVTDAQTSAPLAARLRLDEVSHPDCVPYYRTDPLHGTYYRLLKPQPYTLHLRRFGYASIDETVNIGNSMPTQIAYAMESLAREAFTLSFEEAESGVLLEADLLRIYDTLSDTTLSFTNLETLSMDLPLGVYDIEVLFPAHHPLTRTLVFDGSTDWNLTSWPIDDLPPTQLNRYYSDLGGFVQEGENCVWTMAYNDSMGVHIEDSPGLFSNAAMNSRLALDGDLYLDLPVREDQPGALLFKEYHQLEGAIDSAFVEFSRDGGQTWEIQKTWTGPGEVMQRVNLPISADWVGNFRFAFRVKTDTEIVDSGLHLRDIQLVWNSNVVDVQEPVIQPEFQMLVAPNPFNPSTMLQLTVPAWAAGAEAEVRLHDLLGREVQVLETMSHLKAGVNLYRVGDNDLASGVYFLRVQARHEGRLVWDNAVKLMLVR